MQSTRLEPKQSERGHDYKFWKDFPRPASVMTDANVGRYFNEDCLLPPVMASATSNYGYYSYQDTGNTITPLDTYPGGVWAFATDGTDEDEAWLQVGDATGGMYHFSATDAYNKDQWFETVVDVGNITANASSFFFGLAEKASAVANHVADATGALQTTRAVVGFHSLAATPGALRAVYNTGAGTVVSLGTAVTMVAGTFNRLGLRYRKSNGKCEWWAGGVKVWDVAISAANFPDGVNLTPMWGFKSLTATVQNMYLDRWTYGWIA